MKEEIKTRVRSREIDIMKGLLTLAMILCHCIQFFGDDSRGIQAILAEIINLTTFPGFLFCFGYVSDEAYYRKQFYEAARKMGKNAVRMAAAFYISGIAYTAFSERKAYTSERVLNILMLRVYPGWSEFLASFVAVLLVGILLFPIMKRMNGKIFAVTVVISLAGCFLPYDQIHNSYLALIVGSGDYITFPVLQYWVFYAAGVWISRRKISWYDMRIFVGVLLAGAAFKIFGKMPRRFPPDALYICGGMFGVYLYRQISVGLKYLSGKNRLAGKWTAAAEIIGKNSLYWLLMSNLLIFALSGSKFKYPSVDFAYIVFGAVVIVLGYIRRSAL